MICQAAHLGRQPELERPRAAQPASFRCGDGAPQTRRLNGRHQSTKNGCFIVFDYAGQLGEEDELRAYEDARHSPRAGAGIAAYPAAPLRTTYDSTGSGEPIMRSAAYDGAAYPFASGANAYGSAERAV